MNAPTEPERERLEVIFQKHLAGLSEHFENVHIFCSNLEEGSQSAVGYDEGTGSWFARFGQISEWLEIQKGRARDKGASELH